MQMLVGRAMITGALQKQLSRQETDRRYIPCALTATMPRPRRRSFTAVETALTVGIQPDAGRLVDRNQKQSLLLSERIPTAIILDI